MNPTILICSLLTVNLLTAADHGGSHAPAAAPAAPAAQVPGGPEQTAQGLNSQQALERLIAGNKRFINDVTSRSHHGSDRRLELTKGQHPIAVLVTCSDSRVPPEILFDQGMGDLFVVRTAGNVVDAVALGSIEYACEHLHVPLVMVLGHEKCGAVTAAIGHDAPPGHILAVVENIQNNLMAIKPGEGEPVEQAVQCNARAVARSITNSKPIMEHLVKTNAVKVVSARYDLDSGEVTPLP
jgi:carbonic anhydrase